MKLDLLKKLTALANNNPNDNEANLAARKVCLMLAECKFVLVDEPVIPKSPGWAEPIFRSASNPPDPNPFWEFFRTAYSPRDPYKEPWVRPSEPEEKRQSNYDPFKGDPTIFGDNPFDVSFDFTDTFFGGAVGGGKTPKGFRESDFRKFDPIDNTLEVSCIRCKNWFRISKATFEELRGCVVCADCGSKSK